MDSDLKAVALLCLVGGLAIVLGAWGEVWTWRAKMQAVPADCTVIVK